MKRGNYVVCGARFQSLQILSAIQKSFFNSEVPEQYTWAAAFPDELIPEHFLKLTDYKNGITVPSCRNSDKPYNEDCFVLTVDGFIISDNIEATYMDVDRHAVCLQRPQSRKSWTFRLEMIRNH